MAYRPVRCVGGLSERHRLRRDIAAAAAVRCAQTACQESSVLRGNYCHYSFVCIHGLASFSTVPYCDLVTFKSNLNFFMKAPPLPFLPVSSFFLVGRFRWGRTKGQRAFETGCVQVNLSEQRSGMNSLFPAVLQV